MIVGNGLLASSFLKSDINFDNFVIFASGVSNSKETNPSQFQREFDLLEDTISRNMNKKLIYFSTCSIYEATPKPYTLHKQKIEEYIKENVKNFLILRLPNIVGYSSNENQLTNYIFSKIVSNSNLVVFENVSRNLIDVQDIPVITKLLLDSNTNNLQLDILFNNETTMKDLIEIFENVLNRKAHAKFQYSDSLNYLVDNKVFLNLLSNLSDHLVFNTNPQNIISKYYNARENL